MSVAYAPDPILLVGKENMIQQPDKCHPRIRVFAGLAAMAVLLTGCTAVPAYQQGMVSQPGMYFTSSPIEAAEPALLTQIEPGIASTGGGQAAGCSSCR